MSKAPEAAVKGRAKTRETLPVVTECAKVFVVDPEERILALIKEKDGMWDVPGGQFEKGDTDKRVVVCDETLKETGLQLNIDDLIVIGAMGQVSRKRGEIKVIHFMVYTIADVNPTLTLSSEHTGDPLWTPPKEFCQLPNMPPLYADMAQQHFLG
jgi:8-oxo-dGTP pyrophosphatase MutT (NUDIX family)